ncbi:MAG TPA: short-chain dehydrogenase, partial [Candidatus Thermoplasmatota archaeon]|nr:short-chain dehydrogenase [Candidatus Thermoplasmatota archaeon]
LPWTRRVTQDGVEESLAVNHLAHFLLTDLLRAELRRAAPARVVTVTTTAYAKKLDLEDLQMKKRYTPFAAYARTKLLNVLFTVELARRLEGTGVTANAVHPANMVRSGGGREFQGFVKHLMKALGPFHAAPEKAAREPLRVATDPALEGVSGKLFAGGGERRLAPIAQDSQAAKLVWEESERLVAAQRIRAVLA